MSSSDYYLILGVSPTATSTEIKARFRFLSHAYHPDKFGSAAHRQTAEEDFKRINAAYQILSDPQTRANFDHQRSEPFTPPPSRPNPPPPPYQQPPPSPSATISRASLWTGCLWALAFTCGYFATWGFYLSGYSLLRGEFGIFSFLGVATVLFSWGAVSLFRRGCSRLRIQHSRLHVWFELPLTVAWPLFIYALFVGPAEPAATHALVRAFVFSGIVYVGICYLRSRHLPQRQASRGWWRAILAVLCWDFRVTLFAGIMAWVGIASLIALNRPHQPYTPNPPKSRSTFNPTTARPVREAFQRPATAPNGQPWPTLAAYIRGYPLLAGGGLSSVTVDNGQNSSDVFLKLVSLDSAQAFPVRVCFIPAHAQFTFQAIATGRYDVRYQDLSSGGYSKTEDFTLAETKTNQGTQFSKLSLTLYKVANGNMHTETINESEF